MINTHTQTHIHINIHRQTETDRDRERERLNWRQHREIHKKKYSHAESPHVLVDFEQMISTQEPQYLHEQGSDELILLMNSLIPTSSSLALATGTKVWSIHVIFIPLLQISGIISPMFSFWFQLYLNCQGKQLDSSNIPLNRVSPELVKYLESNFPRVLNP